MAAFEQHFIGRQVKARYQVAAVEDIIAQNRAGIGDAHGVKSRSGYPSSGRPVGAGDVMAPPDFGRSLNPL